MTSTTRVFEPFSGSLWDADFQNIMWSSSNTMTLSASGGLGRITWASGSQTGKYGALTLNSYTSMVHTEIVSKFTARNPVGTVGFGHVHRVTGTSGYAVLSGPANVDMFTIIRFDSNVPASLASLHVPDIALPYYLKTQCIDSTIRLKVWNPDEEEPSWSDESRVTYAVDTTYSSGRGGVLHSGISSSGSYLELDDVIVREITSMPDARTSIVLT